MIFNFNSYFEILFLKLIIKIIFLLIIILLLLFLFFFLYQNHLILITLYVLFSPEA